MEKIFEDNIVMTAAQHRNFAQGLPFYGEKGDFNFVMGRSQFTPGISIKQLPLADLSVNGDVGVSDLTQYVNLLRKMFKPGDRVRAMKMNSMLKEDDDGEIVVGKFDNMKIEYDTKRVRAYIKDPKTLKQSEIYPETLERIFESYSPQTKSIFITDFDTFASNL